MSFLSEHAGRAKLKLPIGKSALQKGMIVSCRYTNKKGGSKSKMLLILNPGYQGKIHALSLNLFNSKTLNNLARKVGLTEIKKYQAKGLQVEKIIMSSASKQFYGSYLRKDVKSVYRDSYRQLFIDKLGSITLIDYKWDKDLLGEQNEN